MSASITGSRAFGGLPLRGNKIMRLVYLDEAGISNPAHEPFLVVAGVAVNADKQFKEIEGYLDGLAKKHIPDEKRGGFAFHAMELFHGTKNFNRTTWEFEKRLEILDDLALIPKKFDLPVCWGATERQSAPGLLSKPTSPLLLEQIIHGNAFFKFVMQIEVVMRATANDEVAMLIAEDRPIMRRMLKIAHAMLQGRAPRRFQEELDNIKGEFFTKLLPLERIIETVHFAQKGKSSLLQVADICAFSIKRGMMKASHSERLFGSLRGQLVFTPSVVDALASTVQPS